MARERRRLLIPPARLGAALGSAAGLELEPAESHYLLRVLRSRPGDSIDLVDGAGRLMAARLESDNRCRLLPDQGAVQPPETCPIELALALPRRDSELVWRMATELGVDGLQPLLADRCQPQPLPLERWRSIVREAVEQCERLWLPRLEEPVSAASWLGQRHGGLALFATTRRGGLPPLEQLLPPPGSAAWPERVHLAIGPEGGWTPDEELAAERGGWVGVSLGPTILRSATAAVATAARVVGWRNLSCSAGFQPCSGNRPDRPQPCDDEAGRPRG